MSSKSRNRATKTLLLAVVFSSLGLTLALLPLRDAHAAEDKASDPWTKSQLLQPADFARELASAKNLDSPTIVCVGFRTLYSGAHIPNAGFHGAAASEQGLAELKKWAASLPRSTHLVVYCGCCPFDRCPNIRPAVAALRDLGFTNLRVLLLPKDFASDWVEKGFPIQKGM
jgi:thiosulfate/3-mercaptopyruvate sulfurtransferase